MAESPPENPTPYYRAYGPWLREKFGGQKVYKVIADAALLVPIEMGRKAMVVVPTVMLIRLLLR
jgi:hypothetical protein